MFKFLHCADIHLDSPLRGLEAYPDAPIEEIRVASRKAFDNLIESAIEERIDFLLIAGDLFDGDWKDYNTGLFFVDRMGRLQRAGIKVFVVAGNHDAATRTTKYMPLPENVTLFSAENYETFRIDSIAVAIHGRSYPEKNIRENFAAAYPARLQGYFNIGLLHTALTGREGHELYAPCSLADLEGKGYDYWALGHVHQQEIIAREPWVIFPGNLQGRHIRETGDKGAVLVSVEEGQVISVEQCEYDVLRWGVCEVDSSACKTVDEVYSKARCTIEAARQNAAGRTLGLRLVLTGICSVHNDLVNRSDRLVDELRGIAAATGQVWLEKVLLRTRCEKDLSQLVSRDPLITGILSFLSELQLQNEDISSLLPELAALKNKMPSELFEGDDPFLDDSQKQIETLRSEVVDLLLARLRHGGRG